jgi:hypothetical protein
MLGTTDLDETTIKHLELLNEKMSEVSQESNSFATKFQFGGIVAVLVARNEHSHDHSNHQNRVLFAMTLCPKE